MSLTEYRNRIDEIDDKILELLEERMNVVKEIAKIKKDENLPIENSEREKELISRLMNKSSDGLGKYNEMIFKTIILASKEYQNDMLKEE